MAGRADVLDQLDAQIMKQAAREKIGHQGTFNANPLCASAAVTTLSIIERGDACEKAEATADAIRKGMAEDPGPKEGVAWGVYGDASAFQVFQNPKKLAIDPMTFDAGKLGFAGLKGVRNPDLAYRLRIALIANGVDIMGSPGGLTSAAHTAEDVAQTLEAFRTSVKWMKADGDV